MIININTTGPWLHAYSPGSNTPYIPESSNPMQGVIRYMSGRSEAWNGSYWTPIDENVSIGMSEQANAAIDWACKKMTEEANLSVLAAKHPMIADLLNEVKLAEEKLKVAVALTQENT